MFTETATTTSSSRSSASSSTDPVYDINVEGTHNFIADGLVTHNSIYGFRGADITQHPRLRGRLPRRRRSSASSRTTARRRRSSTRRTRSSRNNRGRMGKTLWTDLGEGDPIKVRELDDEHAEARFVVGEIERLVDEGVSRTRSPSSTGPTRSRGCSRTRSCAREIALPGHRRDEVLRARRGQGRDRLPDGAGQPAGRRSRSRASPTRPGAGSGRRRCRACSRTRTRWASRVLGRGGGAGGGAGAGHGGGQGVRPLHGDDGARCASARPSSVPVGDLLEEVLHETGYLEALEAERTIEAQGRIENLEELVEVGARVRRARAEARTRSTRSCSSSRCSPTPTRAATTRASSR